MKNVSILFDIKSMFKWIHVMVVVLCVGMFQAFDGDPYKVLGLRKTASQSEIKKAYRQKAKEVIQSNIHVWCASS